MCIICLEEIYPHEDVYFCDQNHEFHMRCIIKWADCRSYTNLGCPICRQSIVLNRRSLRNVKDANFAANFALAQRDSKKIAIKKIRALSIDSAEEEEL